MLDVVVAGGCGTTGEPMESVASAGVVLSGVASSVVVVVGVVDDGPLGAFGVVGELTACEPGSCGEEESGGVSIR